MNNFSICLYDDLIEEKGRRALFCETCNTKLLGERERNCYAEDGEEDILGIVLQCVTMHKRLNPDSGGEWLVYASG